MPTLANDLVQFLMSLFGSREAAEEFLDNPERVLEDHGLGGVCSADVDAAIPVILDFAPITLNASSFDRDYNTGGNTSWTGGGSGGTGGHNPGGGGHGGGRPGGDDHAHAVQQLHHVVNHYSYTSTTTTEVDDRDTIVDQSVNQNIWADGDVRQWFDNDSVVASGDRAVAAGDDVDMEDSNNIEDSYNTDNSTDNSEDNSIRAGGDVNIGNEETDIDDSFNTDLDVDIEDSFNDNSDNSDNSVNDSFNDNSDNSEETEIDVEIEDSFNDNSVDNTDNSETTEVDIEDSFNETDTEISVEESFNEESTETNVEVDVEDSFQDNSEETLTVEETTNNVAVVDSFNPIEVEIEDSFTEETTTNVEVDAELNAELTAEEGGEINL